MTGRTCEGPGPDGTLCGRPHSSNGLCSSHNNQRLRGRPITPLKPYLRNNATTCGYAECRRKATAKGLCYQHRRQQLRGEELHPIPARQDRAQCEVVIDGVRCDRHVKAVDVCDHHYRQRRQNVPFAWPRSIEERAAMARERSVEMAAARRASRAAVVAASPVPDPWVPGTLDHRPPARSAVSPDRAVIGLVPTVDRTQQVRAVGALLALGCDDTTAREIAAMLTAPIPTSQETAA